MTAVILVVVDDDLLEVDDDEPGVALLDPGARRLSLYPLDDGINIWSFLASK